MPKEDYEFTKGAETARFFPSEYYVKLILSGKTLDSVLDKIRAEIKALSPEPTAYDVVDGNPIKDAVWETIADVLKIIDKYKAESEDV